VAAELAADDAEARAELAEEAAEPEVRVVVPLPAARRPEETEDDTLDMLEAMERFADSRALLAEAVWEEMDSLKEEDTLETLAELEDAALAELLDALAASSEAVAEAVDRMGEVPASVIAEAPEAPVATADDMMVATEDTGLTWAMAGAAAARATRKVLVSCMLVVGGVDSGGCLECGGSVLVICVKRAKK